MEGILNLRAKCTDEQHCHLLGYACTCLFQEHLEALSHGWGEKERVITNTLQEGRAGVELRTNMFADRL